MPKTLNHGPICARIFNAVPTLTKQQQATLLDALDGMTEADLHDYASRKAELVKVPLQLRDEQTLLSLSQRLGLLAPAQPGVINLTTGSQDYLANDLKHLTETDC